MRLMHNYGTGHLPCIKESDRELPLVHLSVQKIGAVKPTSDKFMWCLCSGDRMCRDCTSVMFKMCSESVKTVTFQEDSERDTTVPCKQDSE